MDFASSISLSPVEQKQRNTTLSDFEDIEASSKYTSYARANSNCLASSETIRTQTTSRSNIYTHRHARGVGWLAGTSPLIDDHLHLQLKTTFSVKTTFRKEKKRGRIIKRSALLLSICPMNAIPRCSLGGAVFGRPSLVGAVRCALIAGLHRAPLSGGMELPLQYVIEGDVYLKVYK